MEQLLESITENENKIQTLNSWLEAQEEKLKILQKPESAISMEKLLLDCQVRRSSNPAHPVSGYIVPTLVLGKRQDAVVSGDSAPAPLSTQSCVA